MFRRRRPRLELRTVDVSELDRQRQPTLHFRRTSTFDAAGLQPARDHAIFEQAPARTMTMQNHGRK